MVTMRYYSEIVEACRQLIADTLQMKVEEVSSLPDHTNRYAYGYNTAHDFMFTYEGIKLCAHVWTRNHRDRYASLYDVFQTEIGCRVHKYSRFGERLSLAHTDPTGKGDVHEGWISVIEECLNTLPADVQQRRQNNTW